MQNQAEHSPKRIKKALFLDRDGVVNINYGYVFEKENFHFMPGIIELCRKAIKQGYVIIIVTNQSGIARSYYTEHQFKRLTRWMSQHFWKQGIKIKQTFHCPHHPDFSFRCSCRKPRAGMLTKAIKRFSIDKRHSIMIGDSLSDMQAARLAGIGKAVYLRPELPKYKGRLVRPHPFPYYQARNLSAVTALIN